MRVYMTVRVQWRIYMAAFFPFSWFHFGVTVVCLDCTVTGLECHFMLITRIINGTRFRVIYRYFLDVDQYADIFSAYSMQ